MENGLRSIETNDIDALKAVLNTIELFPAEMLDDMIFDYFNNPNTTDIWFTKVEGGIPISIAYCAPEKLTDGTYNLYAIGVKKDIQGKGTGKEMMDYLEQLLKEKGARILIVDTSGTPAMELTRTFYHKCNYTQEAVIRDFWEEGDDKVVFWKKLNVV